MMRNVSFSRNGDVYPHNGLEKKKNHFLAMLATAFLTASSKSMPEVTGSWILLNMFWDSWTLIPSSLTTRAMSSSVQQSLMISSAMIANFTIYLRISNEQIKYLIHWASLTLRSKKLVGLWPWREMMSYGAMSSPAPFTNSWYSHSHLVLCILGQIYRLNFE